MNIADHLHAVIAAVCPIDGVAVQERGVTGAVRIDFAAEATGEQRAEAEAVLAAFDWSTEYVDIITPRQVRLWLIGAGIPLAMIDALLTTEAARVEWEYASEISISNPLVAQVSGALGISAEDVFRAATKL